MPERSEYEPKSEKNEQAPAHKGPTKAEKDAAEARAKAKDEAAAAAQAEHDLEFGSGRQPADQPEVDEAHKSGSTV